MEVVDAPFEQVKAKFIQILGPKAKETVMTIAEVLRQEGRVEGRTEGIATMLLKQLRQRFGNTVDAKIEQKVRAASLSELELWTEQVLSAKSLAELLEASGNV